MCVRVCGGGWWWAGGVACEAGVAVTFFEGADWVGVCGEGWLGVVFVFHTHFVCCVCVCVCLGGWVCILMWTDGYVRERVTLSTRQTNGDDAL